MQPESEPWAVAEILNAGALGTRLSSVVGGIAMSSEGLAMMPVEDPATGDTFAEVVDSPADVVDLAVLDAETTFHGTWRRVSPAERGRLMLSMARHIRDRRSVLARLETLDTGKPLSQARTDVETAARYFEFYAGMADKLMGETLPQAEPTFAYTTREPHGVVAHVTPWNSPLSQMCRGVAPSLAAGNTVVVKPSELTPVSSIYLALLAIEAGFPPGVFNVVTGRGPETGQALTTHAAVRHISFTGSVATGQAILRAASENIVPCTLELGGKSPTIVFGDADVERAGRAAAATVIRNSGQSCFATTRILAHRSVYEQLIDVTTVAVQRLRLGHGLDDPDMGPLVSAAQLARVRGYLDLAATEGAQVAFTGQLDKGLPAGYFLAPTILRDVTNDMRVAREEIFGPVQCIMKFDTEDEAISIANDSDYGLAAGIFTTDLATAHRVSAQLDVGQVQVNRYPAGGVDTPFGGYKKSGMGREKGIAALQHYTQLKTVIISLD